MLYTGVFDNYSNELPTINLVKCHGSINWRREDNFVGRERTVIDNQLRAFKDLSGAFDSQLPAIDIIIKQDTMFTNIDSFDDLIDIVFTKVTDDTVRRLNHYGNKFFSTSDNLVMKINDLQIVLPTKRKFQSTLMEEQYFNMLRFLSYELEREQSVLVTFGFSFLDEHITDIVQRSLNNPNLLVFIFCYKDESEEQIIKRFSFNNIGIPNNVVFISPSDFIIKKIIVDCDKEKCEEEVFSEQSVINCNQEALIYSPEISIRDREAIIDFESFNKIIEGNLSKKYFSAENSEGEINE